MILRNLRGKRISFTISAPSKFLTYFDFAQYESRNFSPLCFDLENIAALIF